jgi:hypothetical protein
MTGPLSHPIDAARHHVHAHGRAYADASIVLGTLLFLILGAVIAITMLLPNLR